MAKGNGTAVAAFFAVAMGVWLIDSGIQGRHPITALESVIKNPTNVKATLSSDTGQFGSVGNNSGGTTSTATASNTQVKNEQAYASSQFSKFGWAQSQLSSLISLWNQESGWNPNAVNSSSGAYGIPQILPSAHPGVNLQGEPDTQIDWGLSYIKSTYGTPAAAEQHEISYGWY